MVYIGRLKKEKMTFWNTIRIIGLFICICIGLYILYYVEYRTNKEGMSNADIASGQDGIRSLLPPHRDLRSPNTTNLVGDLRSPNKFGQRTLSEEGSDATRIVAVPDKNGMSENSFGQADSSKIPKTIWTFWEGPDSDIVNQCIQSWKQHNPDYTVVVLNKKNYKKYVFENIDVDHIKHSGDFTARYADYVRCLILSQHGGFWIDSSIICHAPLSWVHATQNKTGAEFVGYYIHTGTYPEYMKTSPMIENWFFACVPGSLFMQDWCEEFFRTGEYDTISEYLDNVKKQGVSFNNVQNLASPEYLTMHISAQKVMQQPTDGHLYNLFLYSACAGPFAYMYETDWNTAKSVNQLVDKSTYESYYRYPLIKLRGSERTALEQYEGSIIQRAFIGTQGSSRT